MSEPTTAGYSQTTPQKIIRKVKLGEPVPASATLVKIEKEKVRCGEKEICTDSYYDVYEKVPVYEEIEFAYYEVIL